MTIGSKKLFGVLISLAVANTVLAKENNLQIITQQGGYEFVGISKNDISRIYCEIGDIKSVIYSKDKLIEIEQIGQNAFVKLLKKTTTIGDVSTTEGSLEPREVFIECGEKMFSLILTPKDIPSQTVILKNTYTPKKEEARKTERRSDYETVLLGLIKDGFKERIPDGYSVKIHNSPYRDFSELRLSKIKEYIGDSYMITEYAIEAKGDILLEEKMFTPYLQNPLAISIESLNVKNKESVTMVVVSRNGE